jgi:hypothetical protein
MKRTIQKRFIISDPYCYLDLKDSINTVESSIGDLQRNGDKGDCVYPAAEFTNEGFDYRIPEAYGLTDHEAKHSNIYIKCDKGVFVQLSQYRSYGAGPLIDFDTLSIDRRLILNTGHLHI